MAEIRLTTTGTLSPVVIDDFGARSFTHPTTNLDLLAEYTEDEIKSSLDLDAAVTAGYVTLSDENGNSIPDLSLVDRVNVAEGGTTVVTNTDRIDFGLGFGVTNAGSGEADIALDLGEWLPTNAVYLFAYDTTTQPIIPVNAYQDITFNNTGLSNGWSHPAAVSQTTTVSFVDSNPDTITRAAGSFITDGFVAGMQVTVAGTASNNGKYTIDTVAALTLTLSAGSALAVEGPVAADLDAASPEFTCNVTGVYIITVVGTVEKSAGGSPEVAMRLVTDGTEIPGSHFGMDVTSNNTSFTVTRTVIDSISTAEVLKMQIATTAATGVVELVPGGNPGTADQTVSASIAFSRIA